MKLFKTGTNWPFEMTPESAVGSAAWVEGSSQLIRLDADPDACPCSTTENWLPAGVGLELNRNSREYRVTFKLSARVANPGASWLSTWIELVSWVEGWVTDKVSALMSGSRRLWESA